MKNKYELMDKLELKLNKMSQEAKQMKSELEELICFYEVEHFLENGPGGVDPTEL